MGWAPFAYELRVWVLHSSLELYLACVAAVSFPFPNAREREENCEEWQISNFLGHLRRAPSLARFSFACSISAPPEKGKESTATQAKLY